MRSDRERPLDAMEAIERIEKYTRRGEAAFRADELIQAWVVRHFEVLGEALGGVTPALKETLTRAQRPRRRFGPSVP